MLLLSSSSLLLICVVIVDADPVDVTVAVGVVLHHSQHRRLRDKRECRDGTLLVVQAALRNSRVE